MSAATCVNSVRVSAARAFAVCQCCGKHSRAVQCGEHGEPELWHMARGWSTAPFPHNCRHEDGSMGSTFTCPACNKRLRAGETLQLRSYLGGTLRMRRVS